MEHPVAAALQQQINELVARVARSTHEIDELTADSRASMARADAAEARIDQMEARAAVDRRMIEELRAAGVVGQESIEQVKAAITMSRTVGTAIGILMASRRISHDEALVVLDTASERAHVPLHHLAETIIVGAETTN